MEETWMKQYRVWFTDGKQRKSEIVIAEKAQLAERIIKEKYPETKKPKAWLIGKEKATS